MADFKEIKDAFSGTFNLVAEKTKELAGMAYDKAKIASRITKLNLSMNSEKDTIQKAYVEIGKLYYDTHKSNPEGFFVQLCDEITLAKDNLDNLRQQVNNLKAEMKANGASDADIDVEFENVDVDEEPKRDDPSPSDIAPIE